MMVVLCSWFSFVASAHLLPVVVVWLVGASLCSKALGQYGLDVPGVGLASTQHVVLACWA